MAFHVHFALPDGTPVIEQFPAVPRVGDVIELADPVSYEVVEVIWRREPRVDGPPEILEWRPACFLTEWPPTRG